VFFEYIANIYYFYFCGAKVVILLRFCSTFDRKKHIILFKILVFSHSLIFCKKKPYFLLQIIDNHLLSLPSDALTAPDYNTFHAVTHCNFGIICNPHEQLGFVAAYPIFPAKKAA
jgi:hypothetical protein